MLGATAEGGVQEVARAIDFDATGGVFAVGSMAPGSQLTSSAGGSAPMLSGVSGTDAFVAYVDATGQPRWALPLAGSGDEYAYDVVSDGNGGAWVCGTFNGTLAAGSTTLTAVAGGANGFAVHVTAGGSADRVLHIGPAAAVIPGECAIDSAGRLYVSGSYLAAPTINGTALPAPPAGQTGGFLAAYNADGSARWARGYVSSAGFAWRGVAVSGDAAEDILAIGQFRGTATVGTTILTATGGSGSSTWIARLSNTGNVMWAVSPAGESYGRGVRALGDDVVVSGAFRNTLQWNGLAATLSAGGQDMFAARLSASGVAAWSRALGSANDDEGAEIAVDGSRRIYLGGSLGGGITAGSSTLTANGPRDFLLSQWGDDGTLQKLQQVGGSGDDVAYAMEAATNGRIAYAGVGYATVSDGARSMTVRGSYDAVFGTLDALAVTVTQPPAPPQPPTGVQSMAVTIPQRGGGSLSAQIYAPLPATGTYPAVSLLPGGGAPIDSVRWAAEGLAKAGYVVIATLPASGASLSAYHTAAQSGIDYLVSAANPYAALTQTAQVGVAGWSLGARALSRTQDEDPRIKALVAWDNLAEYENGDLGSPNCAGTAATVKRTPRVPALGQASDYCGPPNETPDTKKTAYEWWRGNNQPAMQIVLANSSHFVWGTQGNATTQQAVALYYTQAWFDRWLKNDASATARLLARSVNGASLESTLSTRFRSAAAFDGRNCPDLRAACN